MSKKLPSRVNISLELPGSGTTQKKELPLKLLVLANLSSTESNIPLQKRTRYTVDINTLNHVIKQIKPTLNIQVPHEMHEKQSTPVHLEFKSMDDFSPFQLVQQIPALKQLLAKRYLLNDLKSQLINNPTLSAKLQQFVKNKQQFQTLQKKVRQKVK